MEVPSAVATDAVPSIAQLITVPSPHATRVPPPEVLVKVAPSCDEITVVPSKVEP